MQILVGDRPGVIASLEQMGSLLASGCTLAQALAMSSAKGKRDWQTYCREVAARLRQGQDLTDAMAGHPRTRRYWTPWALALLAAAEASGTLPEFFPVLAADAEQERRQRRRQREMGRSLGLMWLSLLGAIALAIGGLSAAVRLDLWFLALAGSLLVWGMATGQVSWHPRGPTDRETVEQLAALAIPLQAGLSVVASLDLLSRYTPPALRRPWRLAQSQVQLGLPLSQAIALPAVARQILISGEETGDLAPALEHIRQYVREQAEQRSRQLQIYLRLGNMVVLGLLVAIAAVQLLRMLIGLVGT